MAPEGELFANALEVQRRRNLPRPTSLPALVAGDGQVVCTFPEIDVYAKHRTFAASGPLGKTPLPLPLDPAHGKGVFAYLAADYRFTVKLLQVLADTRVPITAFVRDVPEALAGSLSRSGIRLYRTPPQLPTALREVSLVVHHGGIGTSEICLALGRPQLLLSRHLEQHCNATMLENLGVAKSLHGNFSLADGRALLEQTLQDHQIEIRAQKLAVSITERRWRSLELIMGYCAEWAK